MGLLHRNYAKAPVRCVEAECRCVRNGISHAVVVSVGGGIINRFNHIQKTGLICKDSEIMYKTYRIWAKNKNYR